MPRKIPAPSRAKPQVKPQAEPAPPKSAGKAPKRRVPGSADTSVTPEAKAAAAGRAAGVTSGAGVQAKTARSRNAPANAAAATPPVAAKNAGKAAKAKSGTGSSASEKPPAAKPAGVLLAAGKARASGKAAGAGSARPAGKGGAPRAAKGRGNGGGKGGGASAALVAPRRNKAVANAAAAAHGKTLAQAGLWSEDEIVEAFTRFEAQDPEPKGELEHTDPFTLLVAVVLSAQATDTGVNKATRGLFAAASTPQAMVGLGEEGVAHHIRTLGLFRGKAKNVVALSRLLLENYAGIVPQDRAALEDLPGVGRKTANVVLNIAFGVPTIAVDTHLFRVANRTGLAPGATPLAVELGLEARIPERFKLHAHHWLILHGRYICKAVKPACGRCLITDLCRWPDKQF